MGRRLALLRDQGRETPPGAGAAGLAGAPDWNARATLLLRGGGAAVEEIDRVASGPWSRTRRGLAPSGGIELRAAGQKDKQGLCGGGVSINYTPLDSANAAVPMGSVQRERPSRRRGPNGLEHRWHGGDGSNG